MLNLIRFVLIGFVVLFLSGCTTTEGKRGFAVKTFGYEFTCVNEPSQTVIDGEVVKKLLAAAGTLQEPFEVQSDVATNGLDAYTNALNGYTSALNGFVGALNGFTNTLGAQKEDVPETKVLIKNCQDLIKYKSRWWH